MSTDGRGRSSMRWRPPTTAPLNRSDVVDQPLAVYALVFHAQSYAVVDRPLATRLIGHRPIEVHHHRCGVALRVHYSDADDVGLAHHFPLPRLRDDVRIRFTLELP